MKSYPAAISLTGLICMFGALQGTVLTLVVERGNAHIWSIGWDTSLLAYVYGVRTRICDGLYIFKLFHLTLKKRILTMQGLICSGVAYYVSGVIMKDKGPVFVTSFNPLNMVIVAGMSSFILAEQLNVGKYVFQFS